MIQIHGGFTLQLTVTKSITLYTLVTNTHLIELYIWILKYVGESGEINPIGC